MTKVDPKRTLDAYQAKRGAFRIVEVPAMTYLMIDGQGDPNTSPVDTSMLMVPDWVPAEFVDAARDKVAAKKARPARLSGRHHEIYFSDFRRVAPEKLRTVLRQPVAHEANPTPDTRAQ